MEKKLNAIILLLALAAMVVGFLGMTRHIRGLLSVAVVLFVAEGIIIVISMIIKKKNENNP